MNNAKFMIYRSIVECDYDNKSYSILQFIDNTLLVIVFATRVPECEKP